MQDLLIIALSTLPVAELRVALPLAIEVYHFSIPRALFDVYVGNALPIVPLIYGLEVLTNLCDRHFKVCHRVLVKVFERTRTKFQGDYQKYGAIGLFFFVVSPLPFTGVWSGCVAAVLFGIRPRLAIPAILGGMIVSGLMMLAVVKGFVAIF